MDVYYRKLMGNGTVASKFRLEPKTEKTPGASTLPAPEIIPPTTVAATQSSSHHDSNCVRCYKLKKKCSRSYPLCDYCLRSGTACKYIERRRKKQKLEEPSEGSTPLLPANKPSAVSISSLVNRDETEELFRNIDVSNLLPSRTTQRNNSSDSLRALGRGKHYLSLHRKLMSLALRLQPRNKLLDELLVVKAIADLALPSSFMHTFIANYEWKYPFLPQLRLIQRFKTISFDTETLVNLDIYLAMAIGCIIYDLIHGTQHYGAYFSDSHIESILDVITYDFSVDEDLETTNILIFLSIYAINVSNTPLIWSILGYLDRYIVYNADFRSSNGNNLRQRAFWSVFNLDKELSLMLHNPSQFMPTKIISMSAEFSTLLVDGELPHLAALMASAVDLHKLQDRMLSFLLGLEEATTAALTKYSSDLEAWRVRLLLLIHTEYAELLLLQNFIGLVNLDYYYLLIELDQLLSTELFQFTLQFLSNSFSLLLSEQSEKKGVVGTSMHSLFWYLKFFKVVEYKLQALARVLKTELSKTDLNTRLNDFTSNVQLIINLINFLLNHGAGPRRFEAQLRSYLESLTGVNGLLMSFNPLSALATEKQKILDDLDRRSKWKA